MRLRERTCFHHVSLKVLKEQQVPGGPFEKVRSGGAELNAGLFDLGIEASSFSGEWERECERGRLSVPITARSAMKGKGKRKTSPFWQVSRLQLSDVGDINFDWTSKRSKSDPLWIQTTERWWNLWGWIFAFQLFQTVGRDKIVVHTSLFFFPPHPQFPIQTIKKMSDWLYACLLLASLFDLPWFHGKCGKLILCYILCYIYMLHIYIHICQAMFSLVGFLHFARESGITPSTITQTTISETVCSAKPNHQQILPSLLLAWSHV